MPKYNLLLEDKEFKYQPLVEDIDEVDVSLKNPVTSFADEDALVLK